MEQVNIHEAKTRLSQPVDAASQGNEIILARNGRPLAKLMPYVVSTQGDGRGFGSNPNFSKISNTFDEPLDEQTLKSFAGDIFP